MENKKKLWRRCLAILLTLMILPLFSACGDVGSGTPQETQGETDRETEAETVPETESSETDGAPQHTQAYLEFYEGRFHAGAWASKVIFLYSPDLKPEDRIGEKYFVYILLDEAFYDEILKDCELSEEDICFTEKGDFIISAKSDDLLVACYATPQMFVKLAKHPNVENVFPKAWVENQRAAANG